VTNLDTSVTRWVIAHRTPWLTHVMRSVTALGGSAVLIPVVVVAGLVLGRRRGTWAPLAFLAAAYAGAFAGNNVGKWLVRRHRPPLDTFLVHATGYAFPSGHAMQSAAVFGALAVVLIPAGWPARRRQVAWAAAGAGVLLVGASRVYLGVHWTSDVLAGWLLGLLWLLGLVASGLGRRVRPVRNG
jgi:undecaprenyl-diphosphatase